MENPKTLLAKVGHVGELARLLFPFIEDPIRAIGKSELVELANRTAGASHRYPNPDPALDLALSIGLVTEAGRLISLSLQGQAFVRGPFENLTDLNTGQGKLVLALLLDDNLIRKGVDNALEQLEPSQLQNLPSVRLDEPSQELLRVLQQVGAIKIYGSRLEVSPDFEALLFGDSDNTAAGLTEPQLLKQLERQRLRARAAEELVVNAERERLIRAGQPDLARLVSRISSRNVGAGYDVLSFDDNGSRRYIEVKSSTGLRVYFQWSLSERTRADQLKGKYWIYFVPLSYALPKMLAPILTIRDPIAFVRSGNLLEHPNNYVVFEKGSGRSSYDSNADILPTLISWPIR